MADFNFDEWADLAKSDPQAFEVKRKSLIDDVISQAPEEHRKRLQGIQWRLDAERKICKNDLVYLEKVYGQMIDSLFNLRNVLGS